MRRLLRRPGHHPHVLDSAGPGESKEGARVWVCGFCREAMFPRATRGRRVAGAARQPRTGDFDVRRAAHQRKPLSESAIRDRLRAAPWRQELDGLLALNILAGLADSTAATAAVFKVSDGGPVDDTMPEYMAPSRPLLNVSVPKDYYSVLN